MAESEQCPNLWMARMEQMEKAIEEFGGDGLAVLFGYFSERKYIDITSNTRDVASEVGV